MFGDEPYAEATPYATMGGVVFYLACMQIGAKLVYSMDNGTTLVYSSALGSNLAYNLESSCILVYNSAPGSTLVYKLEPGIYIC